MSVDQSHLHEWLGKQEVRHDRVAAGPVAALSATLDRDDPFPAEGDPVPPLWSWLYFLPLHRQSELGEDGHPRRGGFLPPVPLPRRMWAGGRLRFLRDLRIGAEVTRVSSIIGLSEKAGAKGPLIFVTVQHEIRDSEGPLVVEEHDIVYRGMSATLGETAPRKKAPDTHAWFREVCPDDILLFRYSALTFNGHRIHYDRRYATDVEKYPGLVVHGPLIATLLMDLLHRHHPKARVTEFSFRAILPLFDADPLLLCGQPQEDGTAKLWAKNADGDLAMEATARLQTTLAWITQKNDVIPESKG
jgi:3-methylfumaryl-CoA hydratase